MEKINLTILDKRPEGMLNYLAYNGPHFNKKLCNFAVSRMKDRNGQIELMNKEYVDSLLERNNIQIDNAEMYDAVFVANMCKADFLGRSITDEDRLAMYIKDLIDDPDGYDGIAFNRWYADMSNKGIPIEWYDMI